VTEAVNKILITGALGYVGGRISAHLAESASHHEIRLMTSRADAVLPAWAESIEVVRADLKDEDSLRAALNGVHTVIHLAAVDEIVSARDPDLALEINGQGTHRLLQAALSEGVSRFIYMSTFHVYGLGPGQAITEESPTRPVHPYSITHRLAEDFVNWYRHSHGLDTLILRLSNGYGYPMGHDVQRWTLVVNDLCKQAVENGEIRLRSSGGQHRDFIALSDVAHAIDHFLGLPSKQWDDGLFNLGGDCSMSIYEVAQKVSMECLSRHGKEIPVITGEDGEAQDVRPVIYSIEKLKKSGFILAGSMADEIQGTLDLCHQIAQHPGRII